MFQGRLAIQQRVLPLYRKAFFERLAQACEGGMSLYAGRSQPGEAIVEADSLLDAQRYVGRNIHLLRDRFYFCFQAGLLDWLEVRLLPSLLPYFSTSLIVLTHQ